MVMKKFFWNLKGKSELRTKKDFEIYGVDEIKTQISRLFTPGRIRILDLPNKNKNYVKKKVIMNNLNFSQNITINTIKTN